MTTPAPSPSSPLRGTKAHGARGSDTIVASAISPRASRWRAPRSTPLVKRARLSPGVPGKILRAPERKVRWMCSTIRSASKPTTRPVRSGSSASTCFTRAGCSKVENGRARSSTTPLRSCVTSGPSMALLVRRNTGSAERRGSWASVPSSSRISAVPRSPTASTASVGCARSAATARWTSGTQRRRTSARVKASVSARAERTSGSIARREGFVTGGWHSSRGLTRTPRC